MQVYTSTELTQNPFFRVGIQVIFQETILLLVRLLLQWAGLSLPSLSSWRQQKPSALSDNWKNGATVIKSIGSYLYKLLSDTPQTKVFVHAYLKKRKRKNFLHMQQKLLKKLCRGKYFFLLLLISPALC